MFIRLREIHTYVVPQTFFPMWDITNKESYLISLKKVKSHLKYIYIYIYIYIYLFIYLFIFLSFSFKFPFILLGMEESKILGKIPKNRIFFSDGQCGSTNDNQTLLQCLHKNVYFCNNSYHKYCPLLFLMLYAYFQKCLFLLLLKGIGGIDYDIICNNPYHKYCPL